MSNTVASGPASYASEDRAIADQMNRGCFCVELNRPSLSAALSRESGDPTFWETLIEARPHLFSNTPVFLPALAKEAMRAMANAIETVAQTEAYRAAVAAWAPSVALDDFGPRGVFMGYDFHFGDEGPRLIEVNTNAGGAFLNAFLAQAQGFCCAEVEQALAISPLQTFEAAVLAMFDEEWRRQGRTSPLTRIAIVDDSPREQYLYPEFLLARRLFERHGIDAVIADAATLRYEGGLLAATGKPVDLVYNRLVDFAFEQPDHAALRSAYLDGAVVVTPNPHNHSVFADKRNLTLLSDPELLRSWGIPDDLRGVLARIPRTVRVTAKSAQALWEDRKNLFFKPASGYGGKAVYRGAKLTKKTWGDILRADYVAQDLAPPSERTIRLGTETVQRKLDVRLYTYSGEALLAAARLYQGQTTNFRTPGGGFAPVFFL